MLPRPVQPLAAFALVLAVLAACGGDGEGGADDEPALRTYVDVAAMAADLDEAGLTCTLEYEGLDDGTREVSLCTVEGEFTELSVWAEPADAAAAIEQAEEGDDAFVGGANWTVDVDTRSTADAVATALGGTAVGT